MRLPTPPLPAAVTTAGFDSASGMLRALGRFLHGRDFPLLGMGPGAVAPMARAGATALEALPRRWRQELYALGGWAEAVPPSLLGGVRTESLARWSAGHYPERRYPAVMIGSTNGAAMHLAAALGIPWLPQTFLVPVRQSGHAHDPDADLDESRQPGRRLLYANPDLQLHHMHDPNQDLLMIRGMTYFRVKMRRLPEAYRRFIDAHLGPGGTILVADCGMRWPTTTVGGGHVFQHGAYGGLDPEDYRARWGGPDPDGTSPEAEWGYDTALDDDLVPLGDHYRLRWLRFDHPEDLSPVVAELHRRWYGQLGRPISRLLAESFLAVEPHWAQRTASVPYWMAFTVQRSLARLDRWLADVEPFDEIRMTLMPHGVDSEGVGTKQDWRAVLDRATKIGVLLGSDEDRFPVDFGSLTRYHHDLSRVRHRFPLPDPLALNDAEAVLTDIGPAHGVTLDAHPANRPSNASRATGTPTLLASSTS